MKRFKGFFIPVFILLGWLGASHFHWLNPYLVPGPERLLQTAVYLGQKGVLTEHVLTSLTRVAEGFTLTFLLAFPLAVLLGFNRQLEDYVSPLLHFLRHIPPIACIPILILWLGIGEASKLAIIILAAFFPIFLNSLEGFLHCDPKLLEVGQAFHFSLKDRFFKILLPAALPSIILGLRLGLGYSWRALIGAELIAASAGIGYMIIEAEQISRPDIVLVGIIVIGSLGYLIDYIFLNIARLVQPGPRKKVKHDSTDSAGAL